MSNNKGKGRGKSLLKLILAGMLVVILILPLAPQLKAIWELNGRLDELERQKAQLTAANEELEKELQQADSLETVEKIAREQLGMVKQGETRIMQVLP